MAGDLFKDTVWCCSLVPRSSSSPLLHSLRSLGSLTIVVKLVQSSIEEGAAGRFYLEDVSLERGPSAPGAFS